MPLYECHCLGCNLTFEVLAPINQARKACPCPECGRPSQRIVSAFAIASRSAAAGQGQGTERATSKKDQRPLCLQHPHLPLLCHMDETAARRWIAHSEGRGAEFDDKLAKREELRKQRGEPPPVKPAADEHSHDFRRHRSMKADAHAPGHSKSHSHSRQSSHAHDH